MWATSGDQSGAASASFSCDRLPKLDTISFRIGDPAKLSEVIAFVFWIDGDTFVYQTVQHTIQVVHLEIDHCFLCRREVCTLIQSFWIIRSQKYTQKPVIEARHPPMRTV